MILRTLRLHSSAARSYPAASNSLPRSPAVDAGTGAKGKTERALLNFFLENFSQIELMLSWGGFWLFFFFFFLSSVAAVEDDWGAGATV